jgi:cysteine desulfurase
MNYFDNAASTPLYPEVLEVVSQALRDDFANPSAQHSLGQAINEKIEIFREDFLKSVDGVRDDIFIFTSSATESNNLVIHGLNLKEGDIILYSKADHSSVTAPVEKLAEIKNVKLRNIILDKDGCINVEAFNSELNENVKLIVLTHVNNQNGVIANINELTKQAKLKTKAHIHIDAAQSFGKIKISFSTYIDSIGIAAHKLGGPKGAAGLFLKGNHKVQAQLIGGGQENGMRSSTMNYPLMAGFHAAMKIALRDLERNFTKLSEFNERIINQLTAKIPTAIFPFRITSPYIIGFIIPGIPSDVIIRHLEVRDVFISTSSACSSKTISFDPTFEAMNIQEKFHKNFLRISFSALTTNHEIENLVQEFISVWDDIKHMRK